MDESQEVFVEDSIKTYGEILTKVMGMIPKKYVVHSVAEADEPDVEVELCATDYKDIATTVYIGLQRAEERFAKTGQRPTAPQPQGTPQQSPPPMNGGTELASDKQIGYVKYLATNRKQWAYVNEELKRMNKKLETLTSNDARVLIDTLKNK